MKKIVDWYKTRSNALRAALNTAWQTFIGVFGVALLGFISDVAKWADGDVERFPAVSPLGKAAVAALAAAGSFAVTWIIRGFQQYRNPETGPQYN
jgi:hypothetical protein